MDAPFAVSLQIQRLHCTFARRMAGSGQQWQKVVGVALTVAEPEHPELRTAAGWLTLCLLVRAPAGEGAAARNAEARRLCDEFGFDWAERQATARHYPITPAA